MDRGDRPPMDRGGDRWGSGGGGDRDRGGSRFGGGDRPPMDRGDRPPPRGGDRWGGGGGGAGDGGGWRGERAEPAGDRWRGGSGGVGDRDRPPAGERPRLNLAPRSAPRDEPKVDDDGFATVTKKR
jgi:hypothetical protein